MTTLAIENLNRNDSNLGFCYIFGLNKGLKDLADPPHFSPEIGATETLKKSPETAETMASLVARDSNKGDWIRDPSDIDNKQLQSTKIKHSVNY